MLNLRKNEGITLISIVVMIIVIIILAGISLQQGNKLIRTTNIENYSTNMITIRAKAKVYAEEVNSQIWDIEDKEAKRKELYDSEYYMDKINIEDSKIISEIDNIITEGGYECYQITKETLTQMGLQEIADESNDGDYLVVYNEEDYTKLDIIYASGIQYNQNTYYTLSRLQKAMEE